ncbi:MAG TPA: hypothetical protein VGG64_00065 [Pirellulales bacterium]|jgi:hypothetical protein
MSIQEPTIQEIFSAPMSLDEFSALDTLVGRHDKVKQLLVAHGVSKIGADALLERLEEYWNCGEARMTVGRQPQEQR